jgi:hypothetical protein
MIALFTERSLVRDGRSGDLFSHHPAYLVRARRMSEGEVEASSNAPSYAEWVAGLDDPSVSIDELLRDPDAGRSGP